MTKRKAPPGGGNLLNGLQIAPGATQGCRSPYDTSNIEQKIPHFTGYRLQATATTSGLLGHKRPLSLPTGSWLHDQGAITLAFLSLVLWF